VNPRQPQSVPQFHQVFLKVHLRVVVKARQRVLQNLFHLLLARQFQRVNQLQPLLVNQAQSLVQRQSLLRFHLHCLRVPHTLQVSALHRVNHPLNRLHILRVSLSLLQNQVQSPPLLPYLHQLVPRLVLVNPIVLQPLAVSQVVNHQVLQLVILSLLQNLAVKVQVRQFQNHKVLLLVIQRVPVPQVQKAKVIQLL